MKFRAEVFENEKARNKGKPLVISPLSFRVLTAFTVCLIVAIGCFLYWGTYANKKTVSGYILPSKGLITVHASQRGTIVARYVELGDHVQAGQKLYKIVQRHSTLHTTNVNAALMKRYDAQIQSIHAQIELAGQLKTAKISQLQNRQHDLQAQYKHLGGQVQTESAVLKLVKRNLSRYQKLALGGMVSKSDLQKVRQKVLVARLAVEDIRKTRLELQTRLGQIPALLQQAELHAARTIAELKQQANQIEQQRLQLQMAQKVVVRAPSDGIISSVIMRVGQNVTRQTPLLSILPRGSVFEARLLVPTRAIGFIHPGEPVRLRYSAFPYQQFGLYSGTIKKVSRSIIAPGELNLPVSLHEPYYLVTASLEKSYVRAYGKRMSLTSGMTLSADIILSRQKLYEWVLRPIENLRGRL